MKECVWTLIKARKVSMILFEAQENSKNKKERICFLR